LIVVCLLSLSARSYAQGASSSITGVVTDTAGGVVPGAAVVVTSNATGTKYETITNANGAFNVPALPAGAYSVTVSLQGFKSAVITDVRVQIGAPTAIKPVLEVGTLAETVTVTGAGSELVNTQTATVASTLNVDQIAQIPSPTRDLLFGGVTFLVGVNMTGVARGNATVNGLPESFLNITLDGVSNNDNFNKSTDGFFAPVRPRQDAIEAVTVTAAVGGSEVGGHGGVQINFVTRQGTNRYNGSVYEYFRHSALNSNYWFNKRDNLPRNEVTLNQYGIRQGGPIVIPRLYDGRGKAFFFVHHEELHLPNNASRDRDVLHPEALDGWYRYNVTVDGQQVVRRVNVLDLARANGHFASKDPTVARILSNIAAATAKTGTISATTDPLLMEYSWLSPALQTEHQPAIRIDYNIGERHRLTGTFNKLWQDRNPDQLNEFDHRFPDSPNIRHTVVRRPSRSLTLRSTLSPALVSELRFGITRGERLFFGQAESTGPHTFADQDGFAIDLDTDLGLDNWHTSNTLSGRSAYQYTFDETLNWQFGKHGLTFGGSAFLGRAWDDSQQQVLGIDLRFNTANDPANGMFTGGASGNFPGASGGQLTDARALYALLTGRVGGVNAIAALDAATNRYVVNGNRRRAGKLDTYSLFVQDSWRMLPSLTINAGLRWDVQTPFSPVNDTMSAASLADACGVSGLGDGGTFSSCRFFTPGASGGKVPEFVQFTSGTRGYNVDWNNVAPNVGVAWRPMVETGWGRTLLGDPEQATVRGGYSVAYERQGFGVFTGLYGPLPGSTLTLARNANTGLVGPGEAWPVLLSERERLFPAAPPETATYPIAVRPNRADNVSTFHPDIQIASARSWTVGFQRGIGRNTAVELRYVGTRGVNQWATINYNERNLIETGFFDEFRLAMDNLAANNAAGGNRAGSFAYFGQNSGTAPLPIYLAYLNGRTNAGDPAAYTGSSWTNTALTQDMVPTNPQPGNSAADLDGELGRRTAALSAGFAENFFVVNPAVGNANVTDSGAFSDYHALQIELRRRLFRGFSLNANYQYAVEGGSAFLGLHYGRVMDPQDNVRHAIKMQWHWILPVGRGQRYGGNMNALLNGLLGGWEFTGAGRIQARMVDFGNVRLVGMSEQELQDMYEFRIIDDPANPGRELVTMLPEDVILNTRRAFNTSPSTPTGYSALGVPEGRYFAPANSGGCIQRFAGECTSRTLLIRAPWFTRVDIGLTKRFPLRGVMNVEVRADVLNLFDNINFNPSANPGGGATIFQVGSAYQDPDNNFDPGGRLGQLSIRFNW
jgi:hypothetical protein